LVVDKGLNDEMNSSLQVFRFLSVKAKLLNDLLVILRESSFEYLVNMLLLDWAAILDF
jgi:hypothetical protein